MAHVFQVGAGSGGIVVLDLLAREPSVTRVTLVEPDVYNSHNVYRHLFPASAVGRLKGELAAEWVRDRRPDLDVQVLPVDLTAAEHQDAIRAAVAECDAGVCAADNEAAKYHFDALMRAAGKPWAMGEVLSGGIAGWVHRFVPGGPCYGCVASHLQRASAPADPLAPAPDYSNPGGAIQETTVPASRAAIDAVGAMHALVALQMLETAAAGGTRGDGAGIDPEPDFTSLLFSLRRVPGVFDQPFRGHRFRIARSPTCLICSAGPADPGGNLDAALDQALARLGHD